MHTCLRPIAPVAAALALAACFPDPALLDDDVADTHVEADVGADAQPAPDGDPGETDTGETTSGECETPADCQHLAANCVKVLCLANTCATQPDPGASCDDGDACTKDDTCAGTTCAGTAYGCDDGVACTADQCDGEGGCTYPVADGFCRIDNLCVTAGDTKEGDPCRICEGGEAWSPNDGASCEDGDAICTTGDTCAGTTCVGGSRPSDADTDWVLRPVEVVAPSSATIRSIGPAAAYDLYALVEVSGTAGLNDDIETALDGESVVLARRSRTGAVSGAVVYTGFDRARVGAFRRPDAEPWRYVLAVSLEGEGTRAAFGPETALDASGGRQTEILGFSRLGTGFRSSTWSAAVDDASVLPDERLVVTGDFTGTFAPAEAPNHSWSGGSTERPWHRYLAWMSPTGEVEAAAFLESAEFLGGANLQAIPGSSDVWLAVSYRKDLRIEPSTGSPFSLSNTEDTWQYAILRFGPDGQLVSSHAPFSFDAQPSRTDTSFSGPMFVGVIDTGPVLVVSGVPSGTESGITTLTGGDLGQSIVAVTSDWEPLWWVSTVNAGFGLSLNGSPIWMSNGRISAIWQGTPGQAQLIAGDDVFTLETENVGVVTLETSGAVTMARGIATGPLFATSAWHDAEGALAVGLNTAFGDATASGADSSFDLTATGDMTAYSLGLNTSQGLMCLP